MARLCTIIGITGLCFGAAALLFFRPRRQSPGSTERDEDKKVFTWVWIGPGLLFFTFVFLQFVNSGYLLILAPPVFAWLGAWGDDWYAKASGWACTRR